MINIIIDSNKNVQYFAGGRGWKKGNKPPIRERKINYFRNFRTTELIFFLLGLKVKSNIQI